MTGRQSFQRRLHHLTINEDTPTDPPVSGFTQQRRRSITPLLPQRRIHFHQGDLDNLNEAPAPPFLHNIPGTHAFYVRDINSEGRHTAPSQDPSMYHFNHPEGTSTQTLRLPTRPERLYRDSSSIDYNLFHNINRTSSDALYNIWPMDLFRCPDTSKINLPELLKDCQCTHKINDFETTSMNEEFDQFLNRRRTLLNSYRNSLKLEKLNPKKRTYIEIVNEVIDERTIQPSIKDISPQSCSFLKEGIVYSYQKKFELQIDKVNLDDRRVEGHLAFKDEDSLKKWIKRYKFGYEKITKSRNNLKNYIPSNILEFVGETVDFERNDLRYILESTFEELLLRENYSTPEHQIIKLKRAKGYYSSHSNISVRKQLLRWMRITPFCSMTLEDLTHTLSCENCLQVIQERYILMKIRLCDSEVDHFDFLVSIDRKFGSLEMVIVSEIFDDRLISIEEKINFGPNGTYNDKVRRINHKTFKLQLQNNLYESSSIKLT